MKSNKDHVINLTDFKAAFIHFSHVGAAEPAEDTIPDSIKLSL